MAITQAQLSKNNQAGWKIPLLQYIKMPENRVKPWRSILDIDLSKKTLETLNRLTGDQLTILCLYWGINKSGNKEIKARNILNAYKIAKIVEHKGRDGLKQYKAAELRTMCKQVGKNSGAHASKAVNIENLLQWANNNHEFFYTQLAKERHYIEILKALHRGESIPDEVILSLPEYVRLERQVKGLPTDPLQMTTLEWVAYQNRLNGLEADYKGPIYVKEKRGVYTSTKKEQEKHWQIVDKAVKQKRILPKTVVDDHIIQTEKRRQEIVLATPCGPGWVPVEQQSLRSGDMAYKTDGVRVKVIESVVGPEKCIKIYNTLYDWGETLSLNQVWLETPYCIGDKVRWVSPEGKVLTGRIKHVRPRIDEYGEEFYIATGNLLKSIPDQWEYFSAPVKEVELIEPNLWARKKFETIYPIQDLQDMDYVIWTDLDGRKWLGHVHNIHKRNPCNALYIWVYTYETGPLRGPMIMVIREINPPVEITQIKLPATEEAMRKYEKYIKEFNIKPNYATWRFLKRLHDLFGLFLPNF